MRKNSTALKWTYISVMLLIASTVEADYLDEIGYTRLKNDLGLTLADGSGVNVIQVEAGTNWLPDQSDPEFSGKSITDHSFPMSPGISSHATSVAKNFYGISTSVAPGITSIDLYSANGWINNILLGGNGSKPLPRSGRVANQSWVGSAVNALGNSQILRRTDWLVDTDELVQVVGLNNGSVNKPLLGNGYNVIAVGRTDGNHPKTTVVIDSTYTAGRTRPNVVAPKGTTSNAAPVVAATAALLIDTAHQAAERPGEATTNRNGDTIYNAERSEIIKATIMAGADRVTSNSTTANILDYRVDIANQSTNGLDKRYGAGQVNVFNSHAIIRGGEMDSREESSGNAGLIGWAGFDYDSAFGGANNTNTTASYFFDTTDTDHLQLSATLAWNLDIDGGIGRNFDGSATLYDFNLFLYDVTNNDKTLIASSESLIDNTENIGLELDSGHDYMLQVKTGSGVAYNWDYGLAWRVTPSAVPIPAATWLFMSALAMLGGCRKMKNRSV